jgi:hypothetical protein
VMSSRTLLSDHVCENVGVCIYIYIYIYIYILWGEWILPISSTDGFVLNLFWWFVRKIKNMYRKNVVFVYFLLTYLTLVDYFVIIYLSTFP